jgi:hypothetical protein
MKNEILCEVWDNRDKFARRCNYNLDVMAKTFAQIEHDPCITLVDKKKKTPKKWPKRPVRSRQ